MENEIWGGNGVVDSYGIYNDNAAPTIIGNIIHGCLFATNSRGIFNNSSPATIVGNFILGEDATSNSYGMYTQTSNAVIGFNFIRAGTSVQSYGIFATGAAPSLIITSNHIDGGAGSTNSYGLRINIASPSIINNTIYGGTGNTISIGIEIITSAAQVFNNTIDGGGSVASSRGIVVQDASPAISNNIIFFSGPAPVRYGIAESNNLASDPTEVRNNNFFNFNVLYLDESSNPIMTPAGLIAADPGYTGNQSINLMFDAAYRITASIPAASLPLVIYGGLDGIAQGWPFNNDKDDSPRTGNGTDGWSMGAYEYD
jgi:hypothetical protein